MFTFSTIRFLDEVVKELNPDDVTPGVIGFGATVIFAVVIILIVRDLYKRLRRMRYREEVIEEIAREMAAKKDELE